MKPASGCLGQVACNALTLMFCGVLSSACGGRTDEGASRHAASNPNLDAGDAVIGQGEFLDGGKDERETTHVEGASLDAAATDVVVKRTDAAVPTSASGDVTTDADVIATVGNDETALSMRDASVATWQNPIELLPTLDWGTPPATMLDAEAPPEPTVAASEAPDASVPISLQDASGESQLVNEASVSAPPESDTVDGQAPTWDGGVCEPEVTPDDANGCWLSYPAECAESMGNITTICFYDDYGAGFTVHCHCGGDAIDGSYIYDNIDYSNRPEGVSPVLLTGTAACLGAVERCLDQR